MRQLFRCLNREHRKQQEMISSVNSERMFTSLLCSSIVHSWRTETVWSDGQSWRSAAGTVAGSHIIAGHLEWPRASLSISPLRHNEVDWELQQMTAMLIFYPESLAEEWTRIVRTLIQQQRREQRGGGAVPEIENGALPSSYFFQLQIKTWRDRWRPRTRKGWNVCFKHSFSERTFLLEWMLRTQFMFTLWCQHQFYLWICHRLSYLVQYLDHISTDL